MLRLFRAREVRHQQRHFELFEAFGMRVGRREAEPVHTGIDLHRDRPRAIRTPRLELRIGVDDRHEVVFGRARRFDVADTFENVELRQIDDVAQRDAFGNRRHEERRAAFGGESRCDRRRAESVTVGFHDGAALGRRRQRLQRVVVARQRAEIDRQTTRHTQPRLVI